MRQEQITIPFIEEELPSRIDLDNSASMIVHTEPYDDEQKFTG